MNRQLCKGCDFRFLISSRERIFCTKECSVKYRNKLISLKKKKQKRLEYFRKKSKERYYKLHPKGTKKQYVYGKDKKDYHRKYQLKKYREDSLYKLGICVRNRIKSLLKVKIKNNYHKFIGCDIQELKNHLESKFAEGMSWENHGLKGWHIDHIVPLSSGKNKKEILNLCHYTNLQPLWARDNLKKSNKINF